MASIDLRVVRKAVRPYIILTIIFTIMIALFGCSQVVSADTPRVNAGTLDFADGNLSKYQAISLNGQWEFYWQRLLTYDNLHNTNPEPDLYANIPKVWNTYKLDGKSLPGFGYATYRLKIENAQMGQALAIRMPTVSTAYNLYINDKLISSNGRVGMDKQHFSPEYRPVLAKFITPSSNFEIILQVANFSYARGGVWYPVIMGSEENMIIYDKNIGYKDLFLLGAFLIMALYYLCVFLMRKEEKSALQFVLLCFIAIMRTIVYGDYFINRMSPWATYPFIIAIDYISLTWSTVVFSFLTGELFPEQSSRKFNRLFTVYALLISIFVILTPINVYTNIIFIIQAVAVLIVSYSIVCAARAYPKNKTDSTIIMAGILAVIMGGLHDLLYHNNIISAGSGELSTFGFLIFLFLNAFIMARRFSEAFRAANLLSEKLIKLNVLKDEFLANTSHELRTPLNAMISIADGIAMGAVGEVNENQKESLSLISKSGKRLASLVNDILDYSKLKNSEIKICLTSVDLKRVAESVINTLEGFNKTDSVKMLVDIPDDLPKIYADENRLYQIFYNLVGNALKFTESGYIKVSAVKKANLVEICVEDTGVGIPEDKLDVIFESFSQLEASLTRKNGGTGLGLSITKHLVEAHGGEMHVVSNLGIGSKFYFTMLISTDTKIDESPKYEPSEAIEAAGFSVNHFEKLPFKHEGNGPHIVLVDDNKVNLMSLFAILGMKDYTVTAVSSSVEFFEEFNVLSDVSLVILDVMLPGLSGYEICREIRKTYTVSELPVLMLTARVRTEDIVMGMDAGANDYLAKPFDTDELLARVKTLTQLKLSADKALASELAFLQAQIKPHFLYNALNTILAVSIYDIDKARSLILGFGNYLRRSFDFKNLSQLAPLKNEIELVTAYIEIEKARFEERIEVTFDLPDDLEAKIPMLVLQPIVENAVIHGILPKDEGGRIEISIKRDDAFLYFKVSDNGVGMDLDNENSVLTRELKSGVGLSNIDSRLKKLYGKGLQIYTSSGSGTGVSWCVPIKENELEKK